MMESFAIFDARPSLGSFRSHRQSAATTSACRKPRNEADYRSGQASIWRMSVSFVGTETM